MNFKAWLTKTEDVNLGGLEPPKELTLKATVKPDNCGAFKTFTTDGSDLPPTKRRPSMCKAMKKI
jgi:hypothetical protein